MAYKTNKPTYQGQETRVLTSEQTKYRLPKKVAPVAPAPLSRSTTTTHSVRQDLKITIIIAVLLLGLEVFLWWKLR
jgi:hypothetical protein